MPAFGSRFQAATSGVLFGPLTQARPRP